MKKKTILKILIGLLFAYGAAVSIAVLTPLNPFGKGQWLAKGGDFMLRMTEIDCVLEGANPYDVWHGNIVRRPYLPNYGAARRALEGDKEFTEDINAYVPWEYIMMMPFALLPRTLSWLLYFASMLAALYYLFKIGRSFGRRFIGCDRDTAGIVGAAAILLAALPIYQNFHVGNLSVPVLLAAAFMSVCLNHRYDTMAGVCWALAMLKPQLGLLFAIPLLMRKRIETCIFAVGICSMLTLIASLVCNSSLFGMVIQPASANAFAFMGCGTFPHFLTPYLSGNLDIVAGVVVGAAVCAVLTWVLVRSGIRDWFLLLMPAAVIGSAWTYAQCYSFVMNWFFFVVLCASLLKRPRSRFLWVLAAVSVVTMTRVYNFVHVLPKALPNVFPEFLPSESWHWNIDSLLSSVGIVLLVALCVWIVKNKVTPRTKSRWRWLRERL